MPADFALLFLKALAADAGQKIKRDAFLYFDGSGDDFAQCATCRDFAKDQGKCAILGTKVEIKAEYSCCAYIKGEYTGQPIRTLVTPEEVGLVKRKVRCEHCKYGGPQCGLYIELMEKLPDLFDLDIKIKPKACCNANTPK